MIFHNVGVCLKFQISLKARGEGSEWNCIFSFRAMKFPTDRILCIFSVMFFQLGPLIPKEPEQQLQQSGSIWELPMKFRAFPGWTPSDYVSRIIWGFHTPRQEYTVSCTPSKYWVASPNVQLSWLKALKVFSNHLSVHLHLPVRTDANELLKSMKDQRFLFHSPTHLISYTVQLFLTVCCSLFSNVTPVSLLVYKVHWI